MDGERFALVTGGGAGIGKATALALAGSGWHVALAGRRRDKLDEVGAGDRAPRPARDRPRLATSAIPRRSKPCSRRSSASFGRLDLLFNNAGAGAPAVPLDELTYRAVEGGGRRQSQRRVSLRASRLRPDEAAEPARRAHHQQRLDLGPCPAAVLGALYGDEARDHGPHQIDRPRRARIRHRLRADRHRQCADRNGLQDDARACRRPTGGSRSSRRWTRTKSARRSSTWRACRSRPTFSP